MMTDGAAPEKKKIGYVALSLVVILAVFFGLCSLTKLFFNDDIKSYTRLMMHDFYNVDNIDILLIGASHSYRGVDVDIISEARGGKTVMNASSAKQYPDTSLALAKDALKLYDVEEVYMELSHSIAMETGVYKERESMVSTYIITDYMKPSMNKLKLLLNASSPEHYMNSVFIGRRGLYSVDLFNFPYLREIITKKLSPIYRNCEHDYAASDTSWYVKNGYVVTTDRLEEHAFYTKDGWEPYDFSLISEDWKNSLLELIQLCKENDVKLTFYCSPVSDFILAAEGNYDEYIDFVNELIEGTGVEFVDFNLLSNAYYPYTATHYKDIDHLNKWGAEAFSRVFAAYMNGEIPDDVWHESTAERIAEFEPDFYGISYHVETDEFGIKMRTIRLISNKPDDIEYELVMTQSEGNSYTIQSWSNNNELSMYATEHGTLTVYFRDINNPENVHSVNIEI